MSKPVKKPQSAVVGMTAPACKATPMDMRLFDCLFMLEWHGIVKEADSLKFKRRIHKLFDQPDQKKEKQH